MIEEGLEPLQYWDDWEDPRDGQRNWFGDNTKIKHLVLRDPMWDEQNQVVEKYNKKNKRHAQIRKARQDMLVVA